MEHPSSEHCMPLWCSSASLPMTPGIWDCFCFGLLQMVLPLTGVIQVSVQIFASSASKPLAQTVPMPGLEVSSSEELSQFFPQHLYQLTFPPTAHGAFGSYLLLASFCFLFACSVIATLVCVLWDLTLHRMSLSSHILWDILVSSLFCDIKYPDKKQLQGHGGSFQYAIVGELKVKT